MGERVTLACGGVALNSVDDMTEADLGYADTVYEQVLGDDKFTFIEGAKNPKSVTILIKGPNDHTIAQIKDAVRDGLRSAANTCTDRCVVPGAGAFEIATAEHLDNFKRTIKGKARLGVEIFAQALMVVPKTLTENSGLDVMDCILQAQGAHAETKNPVGIDVLTGEPCAPVMEGIFDNYCVKKQMLNLTPVLAQQLLLVDEVIRAGRQMGCVCVRFQYTDDYRTFTIFASSFLPVKFPCLFFNTNKLFRPNTSEWNRTPDSSRNWRPRRE